MYTSPHVEKEADGIWEMTLAQLLLYLLQKMTS